MYIHEIVSISAVIFWQASCECLSGAPDCFSQNLSTPLVQQHQQSVQQSFQLQLEQQNGHCECEQMRKSR